MSLLEWIADPAILASFVTLTVMEIVLGIDNIIFISVIVGRLPPEQSKHARQLGLALALVFRIALLSILFWLIHLTTPIFELAGHAFSWRDLVLLAGGFFLLVKATREIHKDVEAAGEHGADATTGAGFAMVVSQIIVIDLVFSVDSIVTAIGMAEHIGVMIAAVVVAVGIMYAASGAVSGFISRHPTTRMLALAFLLMIGFALVADGVGFHIPRAYLYTAMAFSAAVEALNVIARRQSPQEPPVSAPESLPVAPRAAWFTPPRLIMAVYFVQAVAMTNWAPRIPDVQQRLGLSSGELSICLLSMSLGTFVMTIFNGPLIARFSARTMMAIGMCAFCAMLMLPGLAWNGPTLFVFLFVMGASYVIVDVAMNVEAARIQDAVGRRIMSTCHGFWSIGAVVGSVMGAQFAEASVATWLHLALVAIVVLPLGLMAVRALPVLPAAQAAPAGKRPDHRLPDAGSGRRVHLHLRRGSGRTQRAQLGRGLPARRSRHFGRCDRLGPRPLLTHHGARAAGRRPAHRLPGPRGARAVLCLHRRRRHGGARICQRPADGTRRLCRPRLRRLGRLSARGHRRRGPHRPAACHQRGIGGADRL